MSNIPQELVPLFDSIVPNCNAHKWLVDFYQVNIHTHLFNLIEEGIFGKRGTYTKYNRNPTTYDKCIVLKSFFEVGKEKNACLSPLTRAMKHTVFLNKQLENAFLKELVSGESGFHIEVHLPAYTFEVLREIQHSEVLLYIYTLLERKKEQENLSKKYLELSYWLDKEFHHLGPIAQVVEDDNDRFALLHDPDIKEIDIAILLNDLWYSINGESRIPRYVIKEMMTLKRMFRSYENLINRFAVGNIGLHDIYMFPFACIRFLVDCLYLMLSPYRGLKTLVNELSHLIKIGLSYFMDVTQAEELISSHWAKGIVFAIQWLSYFTLIWACGLPFIPNPIAWLPAVSLTFLIATPLVYSAILGLGIVMVRYLKPYLEKPVSLIKDSARQVESAVRKMDSEVTNRVASGSDFTPVWDTIKDKVSVQSPLPDFESIELDEKTRVYNQVR